MRKIIIGIHGLGNKPPRHMLQQWWQDSIAEGFARIGKPNPNIPFALVYWADILYKQPLNPSIKDSKHPLYLEEPYMPAEKASPTPEPNLKTSIMRYVERQLDKIFLNEDMSLNFTKVSDTIIERYFNDLNAYYADELIAKDEAEFSLREQIRARLADALIEHRRRKILLIGHSMGSIIAYDVLTQTAPQTKIDTFVTLGSPLGLPVIQHRIFMEQKAADPHLEKVKPPDNISAGWYNLSDIEDQVALDHTLADDFGLGPDHARPVDREIYNDYMFAGRRNPHKIYGYLRAPEVATIIDGFRSRKHFAGAWQRCSDLLNRLKDRLGIKTPPRVRSSPSASPDK